MEQLKSPERPNRIKGPYLNAVVGKIHSRCNLACSYCYEYSQDNSWKRKSEVMSLRVIEATARAMGEHALAHALRDMAFAIHGGEPFLARKADPEYFYKLAQILRSHMPPGTTLDLNAQTNATLVTDPIAREMHGLGISLGVSLDGGRAQNLLRLDHAGRESFDQVVEGIEIMQQYEGLFSGILCVINLQNDPIATYQALRDLSPPSLDFLLPVGNWSMPPPGSQPDTTPYADWMIELYDHWLADEEGPPIRIFNEIIRLLLGEPSPLDAISPSPASNITIETNGAITGVSTLKGYSDTGLNILEHSLDQALLHPRIRERQKGYAALSSECLQCDLLDICGSGYYADRLDESRIGPRFRNRSVYCDDLIKLISHIAQSMDEAFDRALAPA